MALRFLNIGENPGVLMRGIPLITVPVPILQPGDLVAVVPTSGSPVLALVRSNTGGSLVTDQGALAATADVRVRAVRGEPQARAQLGGVGASAAARRTMRRK